MNRRSVISRLILNPAVSGYTGSVIDRSKDQRIFLKFKFTPVEVLSDSLITERQANVHHEMNI